MAAFTSPIVAINAATKKCLRCKHLSESKNSGKALFLTKKKKKCSITQRVRLSERFCPRCSSSARTIWDTSGTQMKDWGRLGRPIPQINVLCPTLNKFDQVSFFDTWTPSRTTQRRRLFNTTTTTTTKQPRGKTAGSLDQTSASLPKARSDRWTFRLLRHPGLQTSDWSHIPIKTFHLLLFHSSAMDRSSWALKYRKKLESSSRRCCQCNCLVWTGTQERGKKVNYGQIFAQFLRAGLFQFNTIKVHRLAYMVHIENCQQLDKRVHVSHRCHCPLCISTDHLSLESDLVNIARKRCKVDGLCYGHKGYLDCIFCTCSNSMTSQVWIGSSVLCNGQLSMGCSEWSLPHQQQNRSEDTREPPQLSFKVQGPAGDWLGKSMDLSNIGAKRTTSLFQPTTSSDQKFTVFTFLFGFYNFRVHFDHMLYFSFLWNDILFVEHNTERFPLSKENKNHENKKKNSFFFSTPNTQNVSAFRYLFGNYSNLHKSKPRHPYHKNKNFDPKLPDRNCGCWKKQRFRWCFWSGDVNDWTHHVWEYGANCTLRISWHSDQWSHSWSMFVQPPARRTNLTSEPIAWSSRQLRRADQSQWTDMRWCKWCENWSYLVCWLLCS